MEVAMKQIPSKITVSQIKELIDMYVTIAECHYDCSRKKELLCNTERAARKIYKLINTNYNLYGFW